MVGFCEHLNCNLAGIVKQLVCCQLMELRMDEDAGKIILVPVTFEEELPGVCWTIYFIIS